MRDYTGILKEGEDKIYLVLQSNPWLSYISFGITKGFQEPIISVITKNRVCETFFSRRELSDWLNKQNILKRRFKT
jgi:hypothetical protein